MAQNKLLGIRYSFDDIAYEELDSILQVYLSYDDYMAILSNSKGLKNIF